MARSRRRPESYAERTYDSPFWIVRFAHRRRYSQAIAAALEGGPGCVVDYGAGDGEMLLSLLGDARCPAGLRAVAFEPEVEDLRRHLEAKDAAGQDERLETTGDRASVADGSVDAVMCLGVLEHLTLAERFKFYDFARRVLRPGGRVVIDVPIEIGSSVLIKNVGRRVLKSDPSEYSLAETLRAAVGQKVFDPQRYEPDGREYIVSHKGFDYRLLRQELIGRGFDILTTHNSPVRWLPAWLANQEVVIVASKPAQP